MSKKALEINFTDGASYNAGQVGENRAVELFIHVPQDMYSLEHHYRLVFSNGVVTPLLKIIPPENDGEYGVIRYLLESELTSASNLGMQLEEYGEDGLIDKSSVVSLKFGNSLSKPKEIFLNKDIIYEINQNTISRHTHSNFELLESITEEDLGNVNSKDNDVVLLPFGKPLDLVVRENFNEIQIPKHIESLNPNYFCVGLHEMVNNDPNGTAKRSISLECTETTMRVQLATTDDGGITNIVFTDDGVSWYVKETNESVGAPDLSRFVPTMSWHDCFGRSGNFDYETIMDVGNAPLLEAYRIFCQVVNTSAENMGKLTVDDKAIDIFRGTGIRIGRTYDIALDAGEHEISFDRVYHPDNDGIIRDGYAVVYLTLNGDCDIAFDADLYVGGEVPNTKAGRHKLIYNVLPDATVSLGSLDLEAIV